MGTDDDNGNTRISLIENLSIPIPKESLDKVGPFMHSVFGALAEGGEWLSDVVRIMRYTTVALIMQKAQQFAEKRGLQLRPVPLKFAVPFIERCSLEDEESELTDLWANLLVSAATNYDHSHPAFVDILSQIGPQEAKLLRAMHKQVADKDFDKLDALLTIYDQGTYWNSGPIKVSDDQSSNSFFIMGGSRHDLEKAIAVSSSYSTTIRQQNIQSLEILARQNLVVIASDRRKEDDQDKEYFSVGAVLTPLGYDFVCACEGIPVDQ